VPSAISQGTDSPSISENKDAIELESKVDEGEAVQPEDNKRR